MIPLEAEKIFAKCKNCGRPYKKGIRYPNETCPCCLDLPEEEDEN